MELSFSEFWVLREQEEISRLPMNRNIALEIKKLIAEIHRLIKSKQIPEAHHLYIKYLEGRPQELEQFLRADFPESDDLSEIIRTFNLYRKSLSFQQRYSGVNFIDFVKECNKNPHQGARDIVKLHTHNPQMLNGFLEYITKDFAKKQHPIAMRAFAQTFEMIKLILKNNYPNFNVNAINLTSFK